MERWREDRKREGGTLLGKNRGCEGGLESKRIPEALLHYKPTCVWQQARDRRPSEETRRGRGQSPSERAAWAPSPGAAHWRGAGSGERAGRRGGGGASPGFPSPRRGRPARVQGAGAAPARGSRESRCAPGWAPGRGAGSVGSGRRGVREPRGRRREVWAEPSPPPARPSPAPASRPRPRLERASLAAPGLASRRQRSCGSRGEHQAPPPRELLRPHHAGAGHRDRGPSPALWGLRVSSGAPRAGTHGRGDPRTDRLCAPTLFAPPRPAGAWIRGLLPAQCPGCVLRDQERPASIPFRDPGHDGTCARRAETCSRHPHRAGERVRQSLGSPRLRLSSAPHYLPGDSRLLPGRGRAPWGSFSLCDLRARCLQSLPLVPSPIAHPCLGQGQARSPAVSLALAPGVLVSVFPGGICGTSPAGKLLLRRLWKSGWGGGRSLGCGLHTPWSSARNPCPLGVQAETVWGQQRNAPGSERLVPGNSDLGKRRGPWRSFFQRCLSPRAPRGPAAHLPPTAPSSKELWRLCHSDPNPEHQLRPTPQPPVICHLGAHTSTFPSVSRSGFLSPSAHGCFQTHVKY